MTSNKGSYSQCFVPRPLRKRVLLAFLTFCFSGLSIEEIAKLRKGTVRRKQGLRELVKRQDENYEDNIWDSTPYREQKKKIKVNIF